MYAQRMPLFSLYTCIYGMWFQRELGQFLKNGNFECASHERKHITTSDKLI